jgi:uncharacterized protein (TIGR02246 family)
MKKLFLVLATVLVLAAVGCAPPVDIEAEKAALRERPSQFAKALNEKDVDRMLSFYTDDAELLPPNAPRIKGREAVRAYLAELAESPARDWKSETTNLEVARNGKLAYSVGTYEVTLVGAEGKEVTYRGKWVVIRKKIDGTWKAAIDIWNFDEPAATD